MRHRSLEERYLGVRLSAEELERLDRVVDERNFANRSEAIRHLLREASQPGEPLRAPGERAPRGRMVEVPVTLHRELERSVENGYSSGLTAALEKALERGLEVLAERRSQRVETERRTAELLAKEEAARRGASQEGERQGGA